MARKAPTKSHDQKQETRRRCKRTWMPRCRIQAVLSVEHPSAGQVGLLLKGGHDFMGQQAQALLDLGGREQPTSVHLSHHPIEPKLFF